jgi:RNA polymerase sigma factor (sigma-70 family)
LTAHSVAAREAPRQIEKPAHAKLNSQEERIFELMSEGLTNGEIAERLGLSVSTIRNYVTSILRKLNARNRSMAVSSRGT